MWPLLFLPGPGGVLEKAGIFGMNPSIPPFSAKLLDSPGPLWYHKKNECQAAGQRACL